LLTSLHIAPTTKVAFRLHVDRVSAIGWKQNLIGRNEMKDLIWKLSARIETLKIALMQEDGQDLIEYALVVSLIAFAAVVGMNTLATGINNAFAAISTKLAADI
jgi:pilus assembly protein Flp/PilA